MKDLHTLAKFVEKNTGPTIPFKNIRALITDNSYILGPEIWKRVIDPVFIETKFNHKVKPSN